MALLKTIYESVLTDIESVSAGLRNLKLFSKKQINNPEFDRYMTDIYESFIILQNNVEFIEKFIKTDKVHEGYETVEWRHFDNDFTDEKEKLYKQLLNYICVNIQDEEMEIDIALDMMDEYRCPLDHANERLFNLITDACQDFETDFEDTLEGQDVYEYFNKDVEEFFFDALAAMDNQENE